MKSKILPLLFCAAVWASGENFKIKLKDIGVIKSTNVSSIQVVEVKNQTGRSNDFGFTQVGMLNSRAEVTFEYPIEPFLGDLSKKCLGIQGTNQVVLVVRQLNFSETTTMTSEFTGDDFSVTLYHKGMDGINRHWVTLQTNVKQFGMDVTDLHLKGLVTVLQKLFLESGKRPLADVMAGEARQLEVASASNVSAAPPSSRVPQIPRDLPIVYDRKRNEFAVGPYRINRTQDCEALIRSQGNLQVKELLAKSVALQTTTWVFFWTGAAAMTTGGYILQAKNTQVGVPVSLSGLGVTLVSLVFAAASDNARYRAYDAYNKNLAGKLGILEGGGLDLQITPGFQKMNLTLRF